MPRSLTAGVSLLTLSLALSPARPTRTPPPGMELALQDDAVFVDQRWMERDIGARPRRRARHEADPRQRAVGAAAGRRRRRAHVPAGGPIYDFSPHRRAAGRRGQARHQAAADDHRPRARLGDRRPPGRQQPPGRRQVRRVRHAPSSTHFEGRVDRYAIWNEPNWNTWLVPGQERRRASTARSTRAGYKAAKAADPKAKVLFGELAPVGGGRAIAPLKFLRDVTCSNANYKAAKRCAPLKADGFAIHPVPVHARPAHRRRQPDDVPIGALSRLTKRARQARPAQGAARRRPSARWTST